MWEVDREWYQAAKTLHFGLRLLVGLLIILFCTALFVDSAHAAVVQSTYAGVVWGVGVVEKPTGSIMESYDPVEGCIVNAPNAFSAACFAVGGDPATLTSEQKALLSNASTGGDFYTFTQNFANYGGSFDAPDDWYVPKFYDVWNMFEDLYGDYLYAATFTSAQLRGAKADFQLILDSGSSGGGSSSEGGFAVGSLPDTVYLDSFVGSVMNGNNWSNWSNPEYTHPVFGRHTINLTNKSSFVTSLQNAGMQYVGFILQPSQRKLGNSGSYNAYLYIFESSTPLVLDIQASGSSPEYQTFTVSAEGGVYYSRHTAGVLGTYNTGELNGIFDCDVSSVGSYAGASKQIVGSSNSYFTTFLTYNFGQSAGMPPTNWPDNPTVTAPEPPDIPNPYNPTIDDQPIDPTPPQNPIYPPILSITEETYTADLQGILDAMDAHCQHLRSALHTEMSNLWTALSTKMTNDFTTFRTYMTGQIGWLGDLISDELEATRDYMQQLAEWLAEQIEYSFTGTAYDDNTLISWLRKIYYRLGNGGVNTRPVDPVANPDDEGDWLSQLIANFFSALDSLAGGLLTTVGSALELMQAKFPFSLPWDLLAILGLLEASPIAPDFDVPIYTLSSAGQLLQVGAWEIDLSDLSPYLEGIRWMQKICFIYFLAVNTKSWMETIEKVVA